MIKYDFFDDSNDKFFQGLVTLSHFLHMKNLTRFASPFLPYCKGKKKFNKMGTIHSHGW